MAFWKLQLVLGSDDRPELRLMKATEASREEADFQSMLHMQTAW